MATDSLPPSLVASSVAEEVRRYAGSVALVPAAGLGYWLPGLKVPAGWAIVPTLPDPAPITRMTLCRLMPQKTAWDGIEVIALYQFVGSVPEEVVRDSADRTLRDLDAHNVLRDKVSLPPAVGGTAVRSSGTFVLGDGWLWGQFANYVIDTGAVGGLVEHSVLVRAPLRPRLARDIGELTESVYRTLAASIVGGQKRSNL
jgi:hypothetical protein